MHMTPNWKHISRFKIIIWFVEFYRISRRRECRVLWRAAEIQHYLSDRRSKLPDFYIGSMKIHPDRVNVGVKRMQGSWYKPKNVGVVGNFWHVHECAPVYHCVNISRHLNLTKNIMWLVIWPLGQSLSIQSCNGCKTFSMVSRN